MANKITSLKIEEVSLVDAGANPAAHIQLWKRAPQTETTGDGAQKVELTKESPVAEKEKETVETLTTDLDSVQKRNAELEKELAQVRSELQGEVEKRTQELEAAKAETLKLRKQRRRERFIKAAEELDHLPGTQADDFAEVLDLIEDGLAKSIPDRAAKVFEKFSNLLVSWNTVLEKNDLLFKEIGRDGGDLGMLSGAEAQLEALTREKMATDPKLTHATAYAKVLDEHPDLYRKYRREKGGK